MRIITLLHVRSHYPLKLFGGIRVLKQENSQQAGVKMSWNRHFHTIRERETYFTGVRAFLNTYNATVEWQVTIHLYERHPADIEIIAFVGMKAHVNPQLVPLFYNERGNYHPELTGGVCYDNINGTIYMTLHFDCRGEEHRKTQYLRQGRRMSYRNGSYAFTRLLPPSPDEPDIMVGFDYRQRVVRTVLLGTYTCANDPIRV